LPIHYIHTQDSRLTLCFVYSQRMAVPSARRIQELGNLLGDDGEKRFVETVGVLPSWSKNKNRLDSRVRTGEAPIGTCGDTPTSTLNTSTHATYYETLLKSHHVAREMLNDHPVAQRVAKRVLLFTNRDDPIGELVDGSSASAQTFPGQRKTTPNGRTGFELTSQWREFTNVHGIDIRLFALPKTADDTGSTTTAAVHKTIIPFDGVNGFYKNLVTCCADDTDEDDEEPGQDDGNNPGAGTAANHSNALVLTGTYFAFPKSHHCFISQLVTVCPYIAQYNTDIFLLHSQGTSWWRATAEVTVARVKVPVTAT
jgi:hypothetical protein